MLPQPASFRASMRSTSSFPGVNGSFGSYYRYPEDGEIKEDGRDKVEVNTFPENNNRGTGVMIETFLFSIYAPV